MRYIYERGELLHSRLDEELRLDKEVPVTREAASMRCSEDFLEMLKLVVGCAHEEPGFAGIPILVSPLMPPGMAVVLDSAGLPVRIFQLEGSYTKEKPCRTSSSEPSLARKS